MKTQQPEAIEPNKSVEGIPSKDLFIKMLIKDITLRDAIGDLIDNSVDAAYNNAADKSDLSDFKIKITIDKSHFEIIDNAGGIEEDVARESAFKLGKPKNFKFGKHTIGQFGIGMKRAFFKLGELINVESIALNSKFKITIDVPKWRAKVDEKDWNFKLDSVSKEKHPLRKTMTNICISELKDDAKKQFTEPQFIIDLKNEIALEHFFAIKRGLEIKINNGKLNAPSITIISDKRFKPCFWEHKFRNGLEAEIIVGISKDIGAEGGWYIFCNDRLILGPDTTEITGWKGGRGVGGGEGKELPKYHDQYFRFRGYVFFNADDSAKLPWNTTKTGMDKDSPDFNFVRTQMIIMGKQVKGLMDDLKTERERNNPVDKQLLNNIVKEADTKSVINISEVMLNKKILPTVFKYPEKLLNPAPKKEKRITFTKPSNAVKKAIEHFNVKTANEAGSLAFDYFYDNSIGK